MGKILTVRQKKKQTNKQNKGPTKKISNFQKAAGNIRVLIRNKERKMSWSCTPRPSELNDGVIHVPKELSGFVYTLLTGSIDSSERECCQRVEPLINRGYYMAARRYEISLRVLKNIHEWALRTSEVYFFSTREKKFRISKRPCNILFTT